MKTNSKPIWDPLRNLQKVLTKILRSVLRKCFSNFNEILSILQQSNPYANSIHKKYVTNLLNVDTEFWKGGGIQVLGGLAYLAKQ